MSDKPKITKPMCPGCGEVPADDRQEARPNLCRWCGHNHDTGQPAGFVSASDPFAALDADFADQSPTERNVSSERVSGELRDSIAAIIAGNVDESRFYNAPALQRAATEVILALRSSVKTVGDAAFEAVLNCPHVIEGARVVLKADYEKPGNALAQLHARLSALEAPTPQEPPSEVTEGMVERGLAQYSEGGCMGLSTDERREVVLDILTAALQGDRS